MKSFLPLFLFPFLFSHCIFADHTVIGGGLTVGVREPFETNSFQTVESTASGEACSYNFFYLISLGDSSLYKAKEKANLKTIAFADRIVVHYNILFYFLTISCTRVTGT